MTQCDDRRRNASQPIFLARPHDGGYCLGTGYVLEGGEAVQVVLPADPAAFGSTLVAVPPLAFQEFASTCGEAEGALAFANRYGLLGVAEDHRLFHEVVCGAVSYNDWTAETLEQWGAHARLMRAHTQFWEALCASRFVEIEAHTSDLLQHGALFVPPPPGYALPPPEEAPEPFPPLPGHLPPMLLVGQDDQAVLELWNRAHRATGRERNTHTRELGWWLLALSATARMREARVVEGLVPARTRVRGESSQGKVMLTFKRTAHTLIGALWSQFAMAIGAPHRMCEGCQKLMTIHPDTHRANQTTCSDKCRKRLSRARASASRGDEGSDSAAKERVASGRRGTGRTVQT